MTNSWIPVVVAVVSSSGFFGFMQFILQKKSEKKGVLSKILSELVDIKAKYMDLRRDVLRLQLLDMIHIHPEDVSDIMEIAQEYFVHNGGNWYMSSIFNEWMNEQHISKPEWVK